MAAEEGKPIGSQWSCRWLHGDRSSAVERQDPAPIFARSGPKAIGLSTLQDVGSNPTGLPAVRKMDRPSSPSATLARKTGPNVEGYRSNAGSNPAARADSVLRVRGSKGLGYQTKCTQARCLIRESFPRCQIGAARSSPLDP